MFTQLKRPVARSVAVSRLRGAVLLAGSVRPNPLRRATGRTVLELPLDGRQTILDLWLHRQMEMGRALGLSRLAVRVMVDQAASLAPTVARHGLVEVSVERDPQGYRGVGGLLADIAREYPPDDYLLAAHASRIPWTPLPGAVRALFDAEADVALLCGPHHEPAGLTLIRCGALAKVSPRGFVDFNEQVLAAISGDQDVRTVPYGMVTSGPVRTISSYVAAVRDYHRYSAQASSTSSSRRTSRAKAITPYPDDQNNFAAVNDDTESFKDSVTPAADPSSGFAVIEPGATVHPSAVVHESIVLSGACVNAGATVLRSVVCGGALVSARQWVVDQLVTSAATRRHAMPRFGWVRGKAGRGNKVHSSLLGSGSR